MSVFLNYPPNFLSFCSVRGIVFDTHSFSLFLSCLCLYIQHNHSSSICAVVLNTPYLFPMSVFSVQHSLHISFPLYVYFDLTLYLSISLALFFVIVFNTISLLSPSVFLYITTLSFPSVCILAFYTLFLSFPLSIFFYISIFPSFSLASVCKFVT